MLISMTGFGSCVKKVESLGRVCVELRSTNHKFLETILHMPEGFLSLEERVKKEVEAKVKRGRITCAINIFAKNSSGVFINEGLLKDYLCALRQVKRKFGLQGEPGVEMLIHLPGVLSLAESNVAAEKIWPSLKPLISSAVANLANMRKKEGEALCKYLKARLGNLKLDIAFIKKRFKDVSRLKINALKTPEERVSFLKDADISEELDRLAFHVRNFSHKLNKGSPVGKELDFIAQEMQRESNTMGAKSCDSLLSARVVQVKSQIEKIREQVQNVE